MATGSPEAQRSYNNLGSLFYDSGDLRCAIGFYEKALETAARFGDTGGMRYQQGSLVDLEFHLGRWGDAQRAAERLAV